MFGWHLAALAIFVGLMWWFAKAHSHMWRLVAARYRGNPPSAAIARKLEVTVIAARSLRIPDPLHNPAHRHYPGLILAVHDEGLALSLVPPFNIMCSRLFLPFDEMDLKQTDWALWPDPFAIRMRRLPDIDIIIGRDTVRWLRQIVERAPFGLGV
jgi:hypothetical protein